MVNAVDHLEVLGEAMGLQVLGNNLDALEALIVLLNVVVAVLGEALLLDVELNIDGILGHVCSCFLREEKRKFRSFNSDEMVITYITRAFIPLIH